MRGRSHPCSHFIRFTDEEHTKLHKFLRKRGLTAQAFIHAAAMRAFNEATLGKRTESEIIQEHEEGQRQQRENEASRPTGLGRDFRERILAGREHPHHQSAGRVRAVDDAEDDDTSSSLDSTTPVPVQSSSSQADVDVMLLARTIVEAPQSTRRDVHRAACHTLARGRTQESALQLAEELDAAIKRLDGVPKTALERVRTRMSR